MAVCLSADSEGLDHSILWLYEMLNQHALWSEGGKVLIATCLSKNQAYQIMAAAAIAILHPERVSFLVLDPASPREYNSRILAISNNLLARQGGNGRCEVRTILISQKNAGEEPAGVLNTNGSESRVHAVKIQDFHQPPRPQNHTPFRARIIHILRMDLNDPSLYHTPLCFAYTSGSGGEPKVVPLHRAAILNRLQWGINELKTNQSSVISWFGSLSFVDSTLQMLRWLADPVALVGLRRKSLRSLAAHPPDDMKNLTHLWIVPSNLRALLIGLNRCEETTPNLALLVCSGETFPKKLAIQAHQRWPEARIVNVYGATETTADCAFYTFDPKNPPTGPVLPIGQPVAGFELRENDGELVVASRRGGIPEEIEGTFRSDNLLWFRTGDSCSRDQETGIWTVHGRLKELIKVAGQRVDPREPEAILESCPQVEECMVVYAANILVALAQLDGGEEPKKESTEMKLYSTGQESFLLEFVRSRIPSWMVPSRLLECTQLPRNSSGKLDRPFARAAVEKYLLTEACPSLRNPKAETVKALLVEAVAQARHSLNQGPSPALQFDRTFEQNGFDSMGRAVLAIECEKIMKSGSLSFELLEEINTPNALITELLRRKRRIDFENQQSLERREATDTTSKRHRTGDDSQQRRGSPSPQKRHKPLTEDAKMDEDDEGTIFLRDPQRRRGSPRTCHKLPRDEMGTDDDEEEVLVGIAAVVGESYELRRKPSQRPIHVTRDAIPLRDEFSHKRARSVPRDGESPDLVEQDPELLRPLFCYNMGQCIDTGPCMYRLKGGEDQEDTLGIIATAHSGKVTHLDSEGKVVWERNLKDRVESSPILSRCGRLVIVGCSDHHVYFFSLATGMIHFTVRTNGQVKARGILGPRDRVWIGSYDGHFYVIDPRTKSYDMIERSGTSPIVSAGIFTQNGEVFIGGAWKTGLFAIDTETLDCVADYPMTVPTFTDLKLIPGSEDIVVVAVTGVILRIYFTDDGKMETKWTYETGSQISSPPVFLDGDRMMVFNDNTAVILVNESGAVHSKNTWEDMSVKRSPFQDDQGVLASTSQGEILEICHKTGEPTVIARLPKETFSSPVRLGDMLTVGCRDDNLYAFRNSKLSMRVSENNLPELKIDS